MATIPAVSLNAIERKNLLKKAEQLYRTTHFSQKQVECLLYAYRGLTKSPEGRVDRVTFRDLLHDHFIMSDDFFMDRVYRAFDRDGDGFLSQEEWIVGMSVFLQGTIEEKIKYCFNIYDLNSDGYISREEMFQMLKTTIVKQPTEEDPEEGIKDLVEIMIKKMDHDHDSKVSLEDYKTTIEKERLLIEAFGPCLPSRQHIDTFCKEIFARA